MSEWLATLPWWAWVVIILGVVVAAIWCGFQIWVVAHRGILPDRVRAAASRGIRISDDDAKTSHLHARPWGIIVHVPHGWMTDAEAGRLAGDLAHRWNREVTLVKPTRCVWSLWMQPMWGIHLRKGSH